MPVAKEAGRSGRRQMPDRGSPGSEGSDTRRFGDRREITALFYDLVDSTRLLARSDLEDFHDVVGTFQERVEAVVRLAGGSINETFGDGGLAYFGYPEPLEDGAAAAIHAGLDIVGACQRLASEAAWGDLHVRVGIATSDVVIGGSGSHAGTDVTGLAPVLASRLQALAPSDGVVVSDHARRLARRHFRFRFLGSRTLKGLDEEHDIWAVERRARSATRFLASGRLSARMIDREEEFAIAVEAWRRASAGQGRTLVIVGGAGTGKSRLLHELLHSTREERARLLMFQCSPHGINAALSPLAEVIRHALGRDIERNGPSFDHIASLMRREGIYDPSTIEMIAFAAGVDVPSLSEISRQRLRERILSAVRRCIEEWSKAGPIIIAVEDVHWIDPTSQDLVHDLIDWIRGRPILLVMTTREPLAWVSSDDKTEQMTISGLTAGEAGELVARLLPEGKAKALSPSVVSLIYRRTNGVPLYLEELSQWLAGTHDEAWQDTLSTARISTLENLVSARLGRSGAVKDVAQAASVLGQVFEEEHLHAALPDMPGKRLSATLAELVKANVLVRKRHGARFGYGFRHSMVQEALYGTLLRKARATLHRNFYLAASAEGGWHLPMADAELAEHAERANLLGDAIGRYISAAKESSARSAVVEARNLLERALRLVKEISSDDQRQRLELSALAALGPILTSTQGTRSPEACRLYERAVEMARRRPAHERAEWFPIFWGWWYTGADFGIQRERAAAVMADLKDVDDPEVQLQVRHCIWAIDFNMGRHDTCIAAVDAGLALYEAGRGRESLTRFGGHDPRVCGLGQKGLSLWLMGRPTQALASVEEAVRWSNEIRHVGSIAHALDIAAMLHRYRRDYAVLRRTAAAMRRLAQRHGLPSLAAKALIFDGWCTANLGQAKRGRKAAERGLAIQREIGTREDFPVYSEMMAEILALLSENRAALEHLDEALREAEVTQHLYWVPELCRRKALISARLDPKAPEIATLLERALQVAKEQNATRLFLGAYETVLSLGLSKAIALPLHKWVQSAVERVEQGGEMAALLASIAEKPNSATRR